MRCCHRTRKDHRAMRRTASGWSAGAVHAYTSRASVVTAFKRKQKPRRQSAAGVAVVAGPEGTDDGGEHPAGDVVGGGRNVQVGRGTPSSHAVLQVRGTDLARPSRDVAVSCSVNSRGDRGCVTNAGVRARRQHIGFRRPAMSSRSGPSPMRMTLTAREGDRPMREVAAFVFLSLDGGAEQPDEFVRSVSR